MNVFTLFGELKADTRNFESALIRAEKQIRDTESNLARLENSTKRFSQTSAVTARQQQKFAETIATQKQRLSDATAAFDQGVIGHRKMATVLTQTDARMTTLNGRLKDHSARLQDIGSQAGDISGALAGIGLSFGAMAMFVGRSAIMVDDWRNVLQAATGSTEAAKNKMAELTRVAQASPGVMMNFAVSTYALLRPMQVSEQAINGLIQAFGRIKMSNPSADLAKFAFNLNQLSVAFDLRDVKEAIENFPRFGEILKTAFNLKAEADNVKGLTDELKKLKAEGKLDKETFMGGIADAINKDVNLGKLEDSIGTKMEKLLERVKIRIAPLGKAFLDPFLEEVNKTQIDAKSFDNLTSVLITVAESTMVLPHLLKKAGDGFDGFVKAAQDAGNQLLGAFNNIGFLLGGRLYNAGVSAVQGFINGIRSMLPAASAVSSELGSISANAAKARLETRSPSKVFFRIGKDVAQGFIDGIEAMKASTQNAMASLLDVSGMNLNKADKAGVELLTDLTNDLAKFNAESNIQNTMLDLTAGKYAKLNPLVRERIILAAKELDRLEAIKEGMSQLSDAFSDFIDEYAPQKTKLEELNAILAGPAVQAAIAATTDKYLAMYLAMMKLNAITADMGEGFGGLAPTRGAIGTGASGLGEDKTPLIEQLSVPPKVKADWVDFWDTLERRMRQFQTSLPTFKTVLGENLTASIQGIGDVFANAVSQWDGTAQGFFKSLAQGFKAMVSQIVSELVRLLVVQAIMRAVGAFAGGLGGAGGVGQAAGVRALASAGPGFAAGGAVQGRGTSTSDSILARLSNGEFVMKAKAVKHWGRDFFENLNSNLSMTPAFAGGGFVGGGSIVNNNQRSASNVFHINVSGGGNPQQTGKQIAREAMLALKREEMRNK